MQTLKNILRQTFRPGDRFYSHKELAKLIHTRYGFNLGRHINSKIIRSCGHRPVVRNVGGKAVRGFMLWVSDSFIPGKVRNVEEVHKKVRMLIYGWESLPQAIQMAYRHHRDKYLQEVVDRKQHATEWFYRIIDDTQYLPWPGKDINYLIVPARAEVRKLKGNKSDPTLDKVHFILYDAGYVFINDYVFAKVVTAPVSDGLPDW